MDELKFGLAYHTLFASLVLVVLVENLNQVYIPVDQLISAPYLQSAQVNGLRTFLLFYSFYS